LMRGSENENMRNNGKIQESRGSAVGESSKVAVRRRVKRERRKRR
jgi:hypothetical protein